MFNRPIKERLYVFACQMVCSKYFITARFADLKFSGKVSHSVGIDTLFGNVINAELFKLYQVGRELD